MLLLRQFVYSVLQFGILPFLSTALLSNYQLPDYQIIQ